MTRFEGEPVKFEISIGLIILFGFTLGAITTQMDIDFTLIEGSKWNSILGILIYVIIIYIIYFIAKRIIEHYYVLVRKPIN